MERKKESTRLTIDLPLELHKKLKIKSAMAEKSMRDLVIEAIEGKVQSLSTEIPNDLNT